MSTHISLYMYILYNVSNYIVLICILIYKYAHT